MEYYLAIISFTFVAGITPGPNNMMLMASGLNHGVQKSIPHYLGICFGFPVMVAVVGFGMGAIFSKYPAIFLAIKLSGICYLLFLSWKVANADNLNAKQSTRDPLSFTQAAIFQWLNPKAWVIAVGALAAFTTQDNFTLSVITVIIVYFFMGFLCMGVWLKLGQALQQYLSHGKRRQFFNILMGLLLALSIIPMALSGIRSVTDQFGYMN